MEHIFFEMFKYDLILVFLDQLKILISVSDERVLGTVSLRCLYICATAELFLRHLRSRNSATKSQTCLRLTRPALRFLSCLFPQQQLTW
jgi:hypothetical protein